MRSGSFCRQIRVDIGLDAETIAPPTTTGPQECLIGLHRSPSVPAWLRSEPFSFPQSPPDKEPAKMVVDKQSARYDIKPTL